MRHDTISRALVLSLTMGTATAPDSRYTDNGDGTVTDLATGLIWKQCAEGDIAP